jgi:hypothetical protein
VAGHLPNDQRDLVITAFRHRICEKLEIIPFPHQAAWWAASDGLMLLPHVHDPDGWKVRVPLDANAPEKGVKVETWAVLPREKYNHPAGRAHVLSLLGSFKIGKSYGAGVWLSAFAAVPGSKVSLVGLEYDATAPEFEYILDTLLSERGMNLKADSWVNRPRDGKMWIDFPNGSRYETRSWERRESLKGKEVDCYCFCEAYQLPGIECYTSVSQNLRVRDGYTVFPTTPDRPWVKELRDKAASDDPAFIDWFCESDVDASTNPYSYDPRARERDKQLMTREKFVIHYEGKVGDFVGSVFQFQKGQRQFTPQTHPHLFKRGTKVASIENFVVPDGWEVVSASDTGTFYTAGWVMFDPEGTAYVIGEVPNYRYVGGRAERDEDITIPAWTDVLHRVCQHFGSKPTFWADKNTQFKHELLKYGIALLGNPVPFETRTEITREYFQHNKIYLAPWLQILPHELENAEWPEDVNASGRFARLKQNDHTLDTLEHILSKRPRGIRKSQEKQGSWLYGFFGGQPKRKNADVHLG